MLQGALVKSPTRYLRREGRPGALVEWPSSALELCWPSPSGCSGRMVDQLSRALLVESERVLWSSGRAVVSSFAGQVREGRPGALVERDDQMPWSKGRLGTRGWPTAGL
ncbi:hypothetical protein BVRB_011470 [Beta vulgaris subsp. vulgaris]|uniref:Uncharacterized protein n=1 Tax=Beta vulgaris subsp. vulgaris TaxID=3555 RepID=A0A0J8B5V7_BETVV|nr:hypothetical protein BVRB_011470 [Beta vulgaris subsp. vulgaris]